MPIFKQDNEHFDVNKIIQHWIETSDEDHQTMLSLFSSGAFTWALFLGHLCIEKLLKANYVKVQKRHAPFLHNLYRLAELGDLDVTDELNEYLDRITTFNINARYDDYKQSFYQLCTDSFTAEWIDKIKDCRLWIKTML